MLVLTRKLNESIIIGDDITIEIVRVRGDEVRLGIVAPKDVSVHRQEIYDAIQREKKPTTHTPSAGEDGGVYPRTTRKQQ